MMTRIEDIVDDYSRLTLEERLAKIREIREDRKISKHAITVRKKREVDKGKKLKVLFEGMSAEEKAEFIGRLKGET